MSALMLPLHELSRNCDKSQVIPMTQILDLCWLSKTLGYCEFFPEYNTVWGKFTKWCAQQILPFVESGKVIDLFYRACEYYDNGSINEPPRKWRMDDIYPLYNHCISPETIVIDAIQTFAPILLLPYEHITPPYGMRAVIDSIAIFFDKPCLITELIRLKFREILMTGEWND